MKNQLCLKMQKLNFANVIKSLVAKKSKLKLVGT